MITTEAPDHTFTINGDGKQVRDLLHVSDAVACYLAAHRNIQRAPGQAFNIGGGYANSMSLLDLFQFLEKRLHTRMNPTPLPWRATDQRYFVASNAKASALLGWRPEMRKEDGIDNTIA